MRTKPRLSGRNWQTEAMKPGNGCSVAPTVSALKMMKCTCTSGVGSRRAGAEEAAGITGADGEQPLAEQQRSAARRRRDGASC